MKKELLTFDESIYYYPTNAAIPQIMPNVQHLHHFNGLDETFFQIQGKMFLIHAHSIGGKWCVENTTGANRNSSIELVSLEWKTFENRKHLRFIRGEFNWKSQNRINLDLLAFAYQISTISVCEDPGHSNLFHDHFAFCFVDQNCSDSIYNLHSSFLKPKYKTNDVYEPCYFPIVFFLLLLLVLRSVFIYYGVVGITDQASQINKKSDSECSCVLCCWRYY